MSLFKPKNYLEIFLSVNCTNLSTWSQLWRQRGRLVSASDSQSGGPGSSPTLATCWICSRSSRAQILGHACKSWPTGCLQPVGVLNPVMLYVNYLFSKHLRIVKRFGLLRERRYLSVYYYYYYYYLFKRWITLSII